MEEMRNMQWSINRGFLQYLNALDQGRLEQIIGNLEKAYSEHGSWDFLRGNSRFLIMRLLNAKLDDATFEQLKKGTS
jgi:hypothetical protein